MNTEQPPSMQMGKISIWSAISKYSIVISLLLISLKVLGVLDIGLDPDEAASMTPVAKFLLNHTNFDIRTVMFWSSNLNIFNSAGGMFASILLLVGIGSRFMARLKSKNEAEQTAPSNSDRPSN